MKTRKVISAILAGACAISALSFSATAATGTEKTLSAAGATTFKISAAPVTPKISVSIPSAVSAVINPYGTAVSDTKGSYGADGVTSPIYKIRNFTTDSAVAVKATPSVTISTVKDPADDTGKKFVGTFEWDDQLNAAPSGTDKKAFAWVEGLKQGVSVKYVKPTTGSNTDKYSAFDDGDEGEEAKAIVVETKWTTTSVAKAEFVDLTVYDKTAGVPAPTLDDSDSKLITVVPAAAGEAGTTSDGATYGFSAFRINGYASSMDDVLWDSKDKLTLNLVLNVYPTAKTSTAG